MRYINPLYDHIPACTHRSCVRSVRVSDDRNLTFSMMNIHLLPSTPTLYDDAPELRQLISSSSIYYLGGLPHYTATRG
jgi:hypothetical protein